MLAEAARLAPEQVDTLRERLVAQRAARTFSVEHGTYTVEQKIAMRDELCVQTMAYPIGTGESTNTLHIHRLR